MAAFRIGYFIFLSVARLSWSLDISGSYASMTSVPLWSKNLAMDLVNSASRCCFVLPLMKVSFRVYLSSNLSKDNKSKIKHKDSTSNNTAPNVFKGQHWAGYWWCREHTDRSQPRSYHRNSWSRCPPGTSPPRLHTPWRGTATWHKHKWILTNLPFSLTNCHIKVLSQVQLAKVPGAGSGRISSPLWLWSGRWGPSFHKDRPSGIVTQNIKQWVSLRQQKKWQMSTTPLLRTP